MTSTVGFERRVLDGLANWRDHNHGAISILIEHVDTEIHIRISTDVEGNKLELTRVLPSKQVESLRPEEVNDAADFVVKYMIRDFCAPFPKGVQT